MGKSWSDAAVRNLMNWGACPRCDWSPLEGGWCPRCDADLNSPQALTLAAASRAAIEALEVRQEALDRLPNARRTAQVPAAAPAYAAAPSVARAQPAVERTESQISVQSVLAIAGAGLVAVAAIVFTFFNEALADLTTRSIVVAIISVVFLGAAWLLARGKLQFSAEAVGALAMVFVVLDVWAISTAPQQGVANYSVAAVTTMLVSALMIGLARIRRLRTWLWSGLVGLTLTPVLFGLAVGTQWSTALGWLGLGFVALGAHELARLLSARFESALRVDHITLTVLQFTAVTAVLLQLPLLPADSDAGRVLGISGLFAGLALLSILATRHGAAPVWSFLASAFATVSVGVLPLAGSYVSDGWLLTLLPLAAAGTLAIIAVILRLVPAAEQPAVRRAPLLAGSLTIAVSATLPAAFVALAQLLRVERAGLSEEFSLAAVLGLTALALALLVVAFARRSTIFGSAALATALYALVTFTTWTHFDDATSLILSLVLAAALVPVLVSTRWLKAALLRLRAPLFVAAHVLVIQAAVLTRADVNLGIYGGIAVTIAIAAITVAMPRVVRPVYAAVAFAYGLAVFAYTLDNVTTLETAAIIALTAPLAIVVTLAVTLVRSIGRAYWYAALIVAAIPFSLSVGSLLLGITGWVAIATGIALPLFALVTGMHREGITRELRAGAAALVVPTLSITVMSAVAQFAAQSASPIILPIIAAIVAVTLPMTSMIGRQLEKHGHSEPDAAAVRLLLEISALVTGAIAVLLALLRAAAGFDTTFFVLVIIGLGASATGLFVRRRYAWYVAFISFTGALWALLARSQVTELEPYILPPALAAAAIGAIAVARGKNGLSFYATGLAVAAATPLLVLARSGNGPTTIEWRTIALLTAAAVLVVIGALLVRVVRLAPLRTATLFVGLGAASAGVFQAGRYGFGLDASVYGHGELVMLPVLLFSALAAIIATAAAILLTSEQRLADARLLFVPALVYLIAGPITAFRHGQLYSWTLLILTAVVLAVMLLTVIRARSRQVALPPVWVTFTIATIAAIAGWSEHSVFRVEAYSLTLGAALLAAGIVAWRAEKDVPPTLTTWPIGYRGSWWLFAPGIIVMLGNSLMSTLTDPETWRAILVIALALVAILLGNRLRLAAPFFLGIAALPLEIIFVFAVQAGQKIEPMWWWITLVSAGVLLLVLAVSSERRASGEGGVAARLRDLR